MSYFSVGKSISMRMVLLNESHKLCLPIVSTYIHQLHRYQRRSYNNSSGLLNIFPKESYQTRMCPCLTFGFFFPLLLLPWRIPGLCFACYDKVHTKDWQNEREKVTSVTNACLAREMFLRLQHAWHLLELPCGQVLVQATEVMQS